MFADFLCRVFARQRSPSHRSANIRSPDLAPSDFYLLMNMNKLLESQRFDDDEKLHDAVTGWLQSPVAEFYEEGISKVVKRYDKCLHLNGNYVENSGKL